MADAKKQTDKAREVLKYFGRHNIDLLIHHQPPYGYLDKVGKLAPKPWQGKHAGSKAILEYIRKHQPIYAFCGHIHEGEGMVRIGKTEVYNLGVCGYKIVEF
jgi:Icc-related predicted phosphoesterase